MKRKYGILCLFLLLCLTACGETPEAVADPLQAEVPGGMVYVPEFTKAEFDANYITGACAGGGNVYLVGDAIQESETEGPGGETIPIFLGGTALFQGEPGGAAFRRVEGYRSFDLLDGADGYIMTPGCWPGEEGTVWLWTAVSPWDGQPSRDYVQRFDAAGKKVARFELGALGLAAGDVRCVITDREGRLYASTRDSVFAYDGDGRLLCSLDAPKNAGWDALVLLADGQVALRTAAPAADGAQELRSIHPEAGDWGASYPLPVGGGRVYGGGGDWLYFCTGGDSLYGYDIEAGRLERLLSWTGVSIDSGQVLCAAPLEDGRLLTVTNPGSGAETIVLTPTDPASLPEVTVLTYATLSLDSGTRSKIVEFNKAHPDCRIEVRDYSEYNTGTDPSAGRARLQTELLAGNIPDLLDNSGLPMGQYARRGYLEDLLPWLEGDPDLGREEAVRSFLEFCAAAPLRTEGVEDIYTAALDGELLLLPAELTRLDSCAEVQVYTTAFGGSCSYVGYPREDGGAGSFFRLWDGISMASGCKNKEAAWSFLREAFLPKYPTGIYFGPALPISRADFDRMAEISTGPMLDETGQPMETAGPACVMMPDSDLAIPIRPVTQEEYGHFMVLFNAVDQVYDPDEALTAIIREEALSFLDGSRTLDDTVRLIENRGKLYLQETK